eukprot:666943-Hanusia_phi.AAC.7
MIPPDLVNQVALGLFLNSTLGYVRDTVKNHSNDALYFLSGVHFAFQWNVALMMLSVVTHYYIAWYPLHRFRKYATSMNMTMVQWHFIMFLVVLLSCRSVIFVQAYQNIQEDVPLDSSMLLLGAVIDASFMACFTLFMRQNYIDAVNDTDVNFIIRNTLFFINRSRVDVCVIMCISSYMYLLFNEHEHGLNQNIKIKLMYQKLENSFSCSKNDIPCMKLYAEEYEKLPPKVQPVPIVLIVNMYMLIIASVSLYGFRYTRQYYPLFNRNVSEYKRQVQDASGRTSETYDHKKIQSDHEFFCHYVQRIQVVGSMLIVIGGHALIFLDIVPNNKRSVLIVMMALNTCLHLSVRNMQDKTFTIIYLHPNARTFVSYPIIIMQAVCMYACYDVESYRYYVALIFQRMNIQECRESYLLFNIAVQFQIVTIKNSVFSFIWNQLRHLSYAWPIIEYCFRRAHHQLHEGLSKRATQGPTFPLNKRPSNFIPAPHCVQHPRTLHSPIYRAAPASRGSDAMPAIPNAEALMAGVGTDDRVVLENLIAVLQGMGKELAFGEFEVRTAQNGFVLIGKTASHMVGMSDLQLIKDCNPIRVQNINVFWCEGQKLAVHIKVLNSAAPVTLTEVDVIRVKRKRHFGFL